MNKQKRIIGKSIICILGVIIIILLAVKWLIPTDDKGFGKSVRQQITYLNNVWVMDITDIGISIYDGVYQEYCWADSSKSLATGTDIEQLADITLVGNKVTEILFKKDETISGKVLSIRGDGVELEQLGFVAFSEDMKCYRLYDTLMRCEVDEMVLGYDFQDFVIEDGKICGILLTGNEAMEYIRVMIKTSDYAGTYHESLGISVDTDYELWYGAGEDIVNEYHQSGDPIEFNMDSPYWIADRIKIVPSANSGRITLSGVTRNQGAPAYYGTMELVKSKEGILLINEVLLEDYLKAVVPSEMPASYPQAALQAQAVCARNYAYGHIIKPGSSTLGYHVDDSSSYQVYNNISEQKETTEAVRATTGKLLMDETGTLVETYYYSTSCGFGSDEHVWHPSTEKELSYLNATHISRDTEGTVTICEEDTFEAYIKSTYPEDYEVEEGFYRWQYTVDQIDTDRMLEVLQKRYEANEKLILTQGKDGEWSSKEIKKLNTIQNIYIEKRNAGGVADELIIKTKDATLKVITEHNIRYVLCDGVTQVVKKDGSKVNMNHLLPSAFFYIEPMQKDGIVLGYTLFGGGFGHGAGMSQNGARAMAKDGMSYEEILHFFYQNTTVTAAY